MKDQKPLVPEAVEAESSPAATEQKANHATHKNGVGATGEVRPLRPGFGDKRVRPDMTTQTEIRRRGSRGKLTRDALVKLGKTLVDYYDDVRKEGVPDRFKDLLQQYDERKDSKDKGSS
jgi:hypothetical protein